MNATMYTLRERTIKNCTVQDAVNLAKRRNKGNPVCTNSIRGRSLDEPITLMEVNMLAKDILDNTAYWE